MQIAIIGVGGADGTLGRKLVEKGHKVTLGVRQPEDGKHQRCWRASTVKRVAQHHGRSGRGWPQDHHVRCR